MTELKYINKEQNKNLQIKDLITLGLYTILLILLMGVGVGLGTLFTSVVFGGKVYFATYTSVAAALVCGSAYSLIFNKINKNMAIFIMIAIISLFMGISGHAIVGSITLFIAAILAEFFYRKGNEYFSYLCFNLGNIGIILPMFFRALRGCFFISRLSIFSLQFLIIWRSSGYFWGFQILSHFCWIFRSEFYNAIFLQNDFS